jgi:hypothetical protein
LPVHSADVIPSPAPLNLSHVIMLDSVHVSIIPRDCDAAPSRSDNRALIGCAGFPANAVASFEKSGLVAGHRLDSNRPPANVAS